MRRTALCVVAGLLVGYAFHSIKGVSDPSVFWVGNLSWPYLLVPALACPGSSSLQQACVRASGAATAMVLGFYNVFTVFGATAINFGLPTGTPRSTVLVTAARNYIDLNVLGSGGMPWIPVAAASGTAIAGVFWFCLRHSRLRAFWVLICALGLAEPLLHFAPFLAWAPLGGYRFESTGLVITVVEAAVAIFLLAATQGLMRRRFEPASRPDEAS